MRKIIVILMCLMLCGCGSSEEEYSRGNYNVAYLKIGFGILSGDFDDVNLINHIERLNSTDTTTVYGDSCTLLHISDWEFSRNDTVILYIDDGRVLQTSIDNVVLMYDPNLN